MGDLLKDAWVALLDALVGLWTVTSGLALPLLVALVMLGAVLLMVRAAGRQLDQLDEVPELEPLDQGDGSTMVELEHRPAGRWRGWRWLLVGGLTILGWLLLAAAVGGATVLAWLTVV